MADASTLITLTATNPNYKNQTYTVKPGYSLYFVEKNTTDDSPENDTDRTSADDTAVIVDPQGMIVQP